VLVDGGVLGNVAERYEDALGISVTVIGGGISVSIILRVTARRYSVPKLVTSKRLGHCPKQLNKSITGVESVVTMRQP